MNEHQFEVTYATGETDALGHQEFERVELTAEGETSAQAIINLMTDWQNPEIYPEYAGRHVMSIEHLADLSAEEASIAASQPVAPGEMPTAADILEQFKQSDIWKLHQMVTGEETDDTHEEERR